MDFQNGLQMMYIFAMMFILFWDGSEQSAKLVKKKENQFVRFHWLDNDYESYFEFAIQIDDLTNDVSLIITDFAEDEDEKEEGYTS